MVLYNNKIIKCFLFTIIGDNKEIYSLINYKIGWSNSKYCCRVCFANSKGSNEQILDNGFLRTNKIYFEQLDYVEKFCKESNDNYPISALSKMFMFKHVDIISTLPLDIQHIEYEGLVQKSIKQFLLNYKDFKKDHHYLNLKEFLNNFLDNNYVNFMENINNNNNNKKCVLSSGDAMMLFNVIPFFYMEYFLKNLNLFFIKSFIIHKKYLDILMLKKISQKDLLDLDFLTKGKFFLFFLKIIYLKF